MGINVLGLIVTWAVTEIGKRLLTEVTRPKDEGREFTRPTSEEGATLPVFWGTTELAPNCVAIGQVQKRKRRTAWRYYAGMQQVFCFGPVNELIDISWDDKSARNQNVLVPNVHIAGEGGPAVPDVIEDHPATDPQGVVNTGAEETLEIHGDFMPDADLPGSLFGGNQQGGGVAGRIVVYWGFDEQPIDPYLRDYIYGAQPVSTWPRVCYLRMSSGGEADDHPFYVGANAAQLMPMRAVLRRTAWWEPLGSLSPLGQTGGQATLGYDANPAEILYDLLTNSVYGAGVDPSELDLASFQAAAVTLRNTNMGFDADDLAFKIGFGLSVALNSPTELTEVVQKILDHIDAVLSTNPATGLLRLKLLRADYNPNALPLITPSNARDLKYQPSTWADTVNQVRVTYRRLINSNQRRGLGEAVESSHDQANAQVTGGTRTVTVDYPYCTHKVVARYLAERERVARGVPLATCKWTMNREGFSLQRGDVVSIDWPAYGISGLVVRILRINYGTLGEDDGDIQIEGVQDVFNVTGAPFEAPSGTGFTEPPGDSTGEGGGDDGYPVTWGTHFDDEL